MERTESAVVLTSHAASTHLTNLAEVAVRIGLPTIVATLPLEFTAQIFKLQLVRIVLLVVAIAFLYLVAIGRRTIVIPLSASVVLVSAYAVASVISWAFTRAPGSLNSLLDVTAYPVVALLVVNLVSDEADLRRAWLAIVVSGLAFAILGAFLYFTHMSIWRTDPDGLDRVNATFGDPNIAARFLTLVVCAAILMFAARIRPSWPSVAAVAACAGVLPLTFSKSAYLVFLPVIALAVALSAGRRRAIAMAAVAIAVFAAVALVNPPTRERAEVSVGLVTGTTQNGGSAAIQSQDSLGGGRIDPVRSYLIEAGWAMFRDHPLTGVGFGGYQNAIKTTYNRFLPPERPIYLSHTSAVTILAEQGLVGFLPFAAFLVLLAWEVIAALRRPGRWRSWVVLPAVLIVPIAVLAELEGRFIEEPYLWLALGLLFAARRLEGSVRTLRLPEPR